MTCSSLIISQASSWSPKMFVMPQISASSFM